MSIGQTARSGSTLVVPRSNPDSLHLDGHTVQFYEEDGFLLDNVSRFLGAALNEGNGAIVIATKAHRDGLAQRLTRSGLNVSSLLVRKRLIVLDAGEMLSKFMVNHWPDDGLFKQLIGTVIDHARGVGLRSVAAFGEMVALTWEQGHPEAAIRIEELWNELAQTREFRLMCAYPMSLFSDEHHGPLLKKVCAEHAQSMPAESHMLLNDEQRRSDIISLQHKARLLDTLSAERETLAGRLAREIADLRQLHELSTELSRLDLRQVISGILDVVTSLHNTPMGVLSLVAPGESGPELVLAASRGFSEDFLKSIERVPADNGFRNAALSHRDRAIVEDTETDCTFAADREASRKGGFRAVHSTRLIGRSGRLVGVLSVHFRHPYRPTQREIRLMDVYGQLAVNAIENAQLYEEAQREIAQRKQAQAALIQAEKLASVGRLAATIAHEINNPLEAVNNLVFLAKRDIGNPSRATQRLEAAMEELERVAHITRQTLGFCRDNSSPAVINLSAMLEELLSIYVRKMDARHIKVIKEFDRATSIYAFEGEVRQVFSNLIANAIDAMSAGGTLRLRVSAARAWNNPGTPGARVTVGDNGSGIAAEHRRHLFQPFYTTKKDVGTGLGLWVAQGIIAKHHGVIRVRSSDKEGSHGTVFSVFLPAHAAPLDDTEKAIARN